MYCVAGQIYIIYSYFNFGSQKEMAQSYTTEFANREFREIDSLMSLFCFLNNIRVVGSQIEPIFRDFISNKDYCAMSRQFTYLVRSSRTADEPANKILIENVTRGQIASGFVTRCEKESVYKFYSSYETYSRNNSGYEHEVIFGWQPQRLKFDVDYTTDSPVAKSTEDWLEQLSDGYKPSFIDGAMEKIVEVICECMFLIYGLYISSRDLVITDSSGPKDGGKYKYSYNIIIPDHLVENHEEAREFSNKVIASLPENIAKVVDRGVNKTIQNFRLVNQAKFDGRVKRLAPMAFGSKRNSCDIDTVICPRGLKLTLLSTIEGKQEKKKSAASELSEENVKEILGLDCVAVVIENFKYRMSYGRLIAFDRKNASKCRLCNEIHHRDNTLMLSVAENGTIFEICRHANDKTAFVGEYPRFVDIHSQSRPKKESKSESKNMSLETKGKNKDNGTVSGDSELWFPDLIKRLGGYYDSSESDISGYVNKVSYCEPNMQDYPLVHTLFVRAQMKLGKTKALKKYIDRYFPVNAVTPTIRIITFRQTFSNSIKTSFPDFTLYNSMTGLIKASKYPRLIIQVESLHRLEMYTGVEPVDLLVLDEVESILEQFSSGLHKNFSSSFAAFEWMIRSAKHLVCMDANLSPRTFEVLKLMRLKYMGSTDIKELKNVDMNAKEVKRDSAGALLHLNTFKRAAGDRFEFTLSKGTLISKILEYVSADKKIVIATNSLSDAKTLHHDLTARFRGKQIRLYSSKTPPSEKKAHFSDVATYWSSLDVLIYTPTVSAGISFEVEHFDALFGLFTDKSCPVETCRQMLLRVRNLRESAYFIYLNGTFKNMPTDIDEIRRVALSTRRSLYSMDIPVAFSYADDGSITGLDVDSPFFRLWLENTRVRNLSRNDFIRRFIHQVYGTGATVRLLVATDSSADSLRIFKSAKKNMIAVASMEIAEAKNIGASEVAEIVGQLSTDTNVADVDKGRLLSYEKYKLAEAFAMPLESIIPDFVTDYNHRHVRQIYYNLRKIHDAPTIDAAVEFIRQREIDQRDVMFAFYSSDVAMHKDIQYRYTLNRHRLACTLLCATGFRCLTDKLVIYGPALFANLDAFQITQFLGALRSEFELSPSLSIDKPADRLKIVNSILRSMYGMEIKKHAKCNFILQNNATGNLFEIVRDDAVAGKTLQTKDLVLVENQGPAAIIKPRIISKLMLDTTPEIDLIISVIYTHFYKSLEDE